MDEAGGTRSELARSGWSGGWRFGCAPASIRTRTTGWLYWSEGTLRRCWRRQAAGDGGGRQALIDWSVDLPGAPAGRRWGQAVCRAMTP